MHDYFQILGVPPDAGARDIRAACARHAARPRADLLEVEYRGGIGIPDVSQDAAGPFEPIDVAIDFPNVASVVDRMQCAFFRTPR